MNEQKKPIVIEKTQIEYTKNKSKFSNFVDRFKLYFSVDLKEKSLKESTNFWLMILMIFVSIGIPFSTVTLPSYFSLIVYLPITLILSFFVKDLRYYFIASLITMFRNILVILFYEGVSNWFLSFIGNNQNIVSIVLILISISLTIYNYILVRRKFSENA